MSAKMNTPSIELRTPEPLFRMAASAIRMEKNITAVSYPIRLGQFLKLINAAQDGFEARILIQEGKIRVNGEGERRRGRKLQKNDRVELADGTIYLLQ